MESRNKLKDEIVSEEARLAALMAEVQKSHERIAGLRRELEYSATVTDQILCRDSTMSFIAVPETNAEKIALFHSLFRGREDVFPKRWENPKTGKSGYSPACGNEWKHGICEKGKGAGRGRRTFCGDCPNQAFLTVTDQEIARHLRGDQVMGIFPLLSDESCWFLALDFDKKEWQADVVAFALTCREHGLAPAIERSRSGRGAHVWFFFARPIKAAVARNLGCFLITETMAQRHQVPMESYDRLFPNQDTLPKGGFGNLIALPLQREARSQDNTIFVDHEFQPWADQWAFLAGVPRLDPSRVDGLVGEASRRGKVIGVRAADALDDDGRKPWEKAVSGSERRPPLSGPLPSAVNGVLCQKLFIEKKGLPSALLNQLKRLAAFQNPEFYKKQRLRFSTAMTPRIISCAEELPEYIALPRGCLPDAEGMLNDYGVTFNLEDKREPGTRQDFVFIGRLSAFQEEAVQALLAHDAGVLVAPPAMGKTVVGAFMVAARRVSTLILVHRKPLLSQWVAQLSQFLDLDVKEIGQIGAGKTKPTGRLDVAMIQSLVRKGIVKDLVADYGQVIVDEAHHCPAFSFEQVLSAAKARYIVGLTATPQRLDGHHPILWMQMGPIRYRLNPKSSVTQPPFEQRLIVRDTDFRCEIEGVGIQEIYAALVNDNSRNDIIFDDVIAALEAKRSPLVLTERRDHLDHFAERFAKFARNLVVLHGGMKSKERKAALSRLATLPADEERLVLATGRYIGEGFDDGRLDTLFLALPISWKGTLVQYAGRLQRRHPGKAEVRIYDYVDREVPMLAKMFRKRILGYQSLGYRIS